MSRAAANSFTRGRTIRMLFSCFIAEFAELEIPELYITGRTQCQKMHVERI